MPFSTPSSTPAPAPAFVTWRHRGEHFLAVPHDGGVAIVSEHGDWYGAWESVARFRSVQAGTATGQGKALRQAAATPLPGRAAVGVRTRAPG